MTAKQDIGHLTLANDKDDDKTNTFQVTYWNIEMSFWSRSINDVKSNWQHMGDIDCFVTKNKVLSVKLLAA